MPDVVLQKQLTEVFFLFPEYIDTYHKASAPYIRDMEYCYVEQQPVFVDRLVKLLEFFSYERNVDKYYDKKNLDGMLYPYQELAYPDVDEEVRITLRDFDVVDWREELGEDNDIIEWHGTRIMNDTCAKVYERAIIDNHNLLVHASLFAVEDAIENDDSAIVFKKNNTSCSLFYHKTIQDLYTWLSDNRIPKRQFQYCKKHGEYGKGGWILLNGKHTALLDCGREHAQIMLHKAIGDMSVNKDLWYYDAEYGKVLYFEYQNDSPQNEYHGYHLKQGEEGYNKVNLGLLRQIQDDIPANL